MPQLYYVAAHVKKQQGCNIRRQMQIVETPQDKIIEALETEVTKLKNQLSDTEEKYQKMRKKFDDLMIKTHGGGRK